MSAAPVTLSDSLSTVSSSHAMQPHSHLQPEILVEGYDCLAALFSSAFRRRISKICSCSCVMLEGTRGVAGESRAEEGEG